MLKNAVCITDSRFENTAPLPVFHRENEPFDNRHPAEYENRHILFRRAFSLDSLPGQAVLSISADDYYKLYVNGTYVTQGPAPGYPFHYYYNDIDIKPYLRTGRNVIAVHTYYQGLYNRVWVSADLRHMMICSLSCDGEEVLVSDTGWKCAEHTGYLWAGTRKFAEYRIGISCDCRYFRIGARKFGYDTQFAEDFDSRAPETGFEDPDYDDSAWSYACVKRNTDYTFFPQPTKQLDVYDITPAQIRRTACPDGTILVDGDIGFECVGALTLKAKGLAGTVVSIRCGEETDESGVVRHNMRCNCVYEEFWTLSGRWDTLVPFDYKGMRYFRLRLPAGCSLSDADIRMRVRHYPFREAIACPSDDPTLQAVWKLCADTIRYAVQEVYMDCPTREKGQYLGDGTVSSAAHLLLTGDGAMMKKALYEYARSTFITDGIMTVAPCSFSQEIADYSMQYPHQLLWYFRRTQDRETLEALAPYCEAAVSHFRRFDRGDGLLEGVDTWNLIDWPENLRDHYDFPATRPVAPGAHNVINAFWYGMLSDMDAIRQLLGEKTDAAYTARVGEAFVREFYDPAQHLFTDTKNTAHTASHSNFLAMYVGLDRYVGEDIRANIVSLIRERGFCMGVYMSYFMLAALKKAGYEALAVEMLKSPDGWCKMLSEGATTLFEAWGKEQKWNTSLCHPWAAAPILILADPM